MSDLATSKLLSLLLRHDPGQAGLSLDPGGWVGLDDLVDALAGRGIGREDILRVVAGSDKQRFTLSADGLRLRAAQGHSVPVDLGLVPSAPPETLWHGTAERSVPAIRSEGLRPMSRQQVHLSPDPATARRVGARHGTPVVLAVAAGAMARDGHLFWQADNGVWLTDAVPPRYLGRDPA